MKKRLLAILLTVCMVISMAPTALAAEESQPSGNAELSETAQAALEAVQPEQPGASLSGSGTESDPYQINNIGDLKLFRDTVNNAQTDGSNQYTGKYVKLNADIDLSGENWDPIGSMNGDHGAFKGIFDGGNHTISNLKVEKEGQGLGLFARTANATIKNLTLNNVTLTSTDNSNYAGGVVGNAFVTDFENVHVTGTVNISGRGYIGAIAGHGYGEYNDVSAKATCTISSTFWCAGGVIGYLGEGSSIENAVVEGLTIKSAAGGLGSIVGMSEDNNGTQPCTSKNLSAKNVKIQTYTGGYGDAYAEYALGYLIGGNPALMSGTNTAKNVEFSCSNGNTNPTVTDAVASVGDEIYFILQEAVNAASDKTVTLLRDVTLTEGLTLPNGVDVTIDLNGKTLNGYVAPCEPTALTLKNGDIVNTNADVSAIEINAGTLTLTDVDVDSARHAVRIDGAVNATIDGGSYKGAVNSTGKTAHGVNISGAANVTINGGNFYGPKANTASDSGAAVNVQAGAIVTINGGKFVDGKNNTLASKGTLTVFGGTFDQDPTAFVAEGYKVVEKDGTYKVMDSAVAKIGDTKYESFVAAVAAANDGDTIELVAKDQVISMAANVVGGKTITVTGTATVDWTQGNLMIGRGGEGDGTVIFDNATIYSSVKKNPASTGIHVSGSKANDNTTNNGTLVIKDSTIELDYLINRNSTTVEGDSKLTIYGGIYTHGRNEDESGIEGGMTATLLVGDDATVDVKNENGMGVGGESNGVMTVKGTYEANILHVQANGVVNVEGGILKAPTAVNAGTINISGTSDIAANVTGDGWVYMNGVTLSEETNLIGAKVRFVSGESDINGSTIDDGWFQVGYGVYHGEPENPVNVTVNVKNAVVGSNGKDYAGWVGTGWFENDEAKAAAMTEGVKYVLNIEDSEAWFGYMHVSNDGELNVKGKVDPQPHYNNSYYSFASGHMIINGVANFDATDVLAFDTYVSNDNGTDKPGTVNIINGTEYEVEPHNGAHSGNGLVMKNAGVVNVDAASKMHNDEKSNIAADAKLNVAGEATLVGAVTNDGTITLTSEGSTLNAVEGVTVTSGVEGFAPQFENGAYKLNRVGYFSVIDSEENSTTYYMTLSEALTSAQSGDTVKMLIDSSADQLTIDKAITLDLGGNTLTTTSGWGGLLLKNGCSLKNGTLNHTGNTAAIKAWDVVAIEDVEINVAYTEGKTKGGIVIQSGAAGIDSIKNVTIQGEGLTNGIETYNCGNATDPVIGSMENVTIDAVGVGLNISAPCGTATNCTIEGGVSGIELWIKGTYSATLDLVNCDVSGDERAVYIHDEFSSNPDIENVGTLKLTVDEETILESTNGVLMTKTIARAENVDVGEVEVMAVAKVGDDYYADIQEAIKAAAPRGTVDVLADVTVDEWVMFAQNLTIGNGNLITLDMDGLTINGNGHKLTVNSIESASNGNRLFSEAENLNIKNWNIEVANGVNGGISLKSGTIENVNFIGSANAILPGSGTVNVTGCTFDTTGHSIYTENTEGVLNITGCTFNGTKDEYAVVLRNGESTFKNNVCNTKVNFLADGVAANATNNTFKARVKFYTSDETLSGNAFVDGGYIELDADTLTGIDVSGNFWGGSAPSEEQAPANVTCNTHYADCSFEEDGRIKELSNLVDPDEAVPVTGVTLDRTAVTLTTAGATEFLFATVAPDNANYESVSWTSSNPSVATVDENGIVTAVSNGTAVITVNVDGKTATCTVTVSIRTGGSGGGGGGSSSYTITVEETKNGEIEVSPSRASKGTTVTITVDPDAGYELDTLTILDKNGKEVELTKKSDTKYTFKMPSGKVTVEAAFAEIEVFENPFVDVADGVYYYDAVLWAAENGITGGTSATTFSPSAACTRAQTVTFLWRAAGSPEPETTNMPFTDVVEGSYYYDAVLWAVENGITSGTSATTFSPDATVTRAQNVTFLWRWAESPAAEQASSFADVAADAYYHDAVAWAAEEGITSGTSATTFSPNDPCLRSQIVTFLYRYMVG